MKTSHCSKSPMPPIRQSLGRAFTLITKIKILTVGIFLTAIIDSFGQTDGTIEFMVGYDRGVSEVAGPAKLYVLRIGDTTGTVTVDYATSDGTATAGLDYTATAGTLVFGPLEEQKTITVP